MRLYFVRHGQTDWNTDGRAQGHRNVGLDEVGLAQAEATADFFHDRVVHRVIASDLERCIQTARPTADLTECDLEERTELRERAFGILEGQHYTVLRAWFDGEMRDRKLEWHETRPDGGESLEDVWNRCDPLMVELAKESEDTVIFSHGGTLGLMLCQLLRADIRVARSFRFGNCSITELKRRPDGIWQLVRFADQSHLRGLIEED